MEVKIESSKLLKPAYESDGPPPELQYVRLSPFDNVTDDAHFAVLCAFRPPTPPNSVWERSCARVITKFREWAGRLVTDPEGHPAIVLNDAGARFVEATVDAAHDDVIPVGEPSPAWLELHPSPYGVEELGQVQLTRFSCGTLVVGFTYHHRLGDGHSTTHFLVSWAQACRSLADGDADFDLGPGPLHERAAFFPPRSPPVVEFEHRGTEYKKKGTATCARGYEPAEEIVVHRAHFPREFLAKLKAKASEDEVSQGRRQYSTFESLMAHLWRAVTKARGLPAGETSRLRLAVNGRARLRPPVPDRFFGNLVLWAICRADTGEIAGRPLQHAARVIRDQIATMGDRYFKSFIDFTSSGAVEAEGLEPLADPELQALSPDMDVYSWLGFPMSLMDFGAGSPIYFVPTYVPVEGLLVLLPSLLGEEGSIDAYVPLYRSNLDAFKRMCYSLDDDEEHDNDDDDDVEEMENSVIGE